MNASAKSGGRLTYRVHQATAVVSRVIERTLSCQPSEACCFHQATAASTTSFLQRRAATSTRTAVSRLDVQLSTRRSTLAPATELTPIAILTPPAFSKASASSLVSSVQSSVVFGPGPSVMKLLVS